MRTLLALALAATVFAGCESGLDAPMAALSLQTRDALDVLPADAQMVAMVNVEAVRTTPFFADHSGPFGAESMDAESAARFEQFVRLTGFDPEEDIRRIYLAVVEEDHPAFVVYADFDRARIDDYLERNTPDGFTWTSYRDLPVYLVREDDRTFGFSILSDEMMVAGDEPTLHAMIDRVATGAGGLSTNATLMGLIERASYPDEAWFVLRDFDTPDHDEAGDGEPTMQELAHAMRLVDQAVVSFDFQPSGVAMTALGLTGSAQRAEDVADVVRGSVAVMRTGMQDEPAFADILDNVRVRAQSDAVQIQATLPEAFFETARHHD